MNSLPILEVKELSVSFQNEAQSFHALDGVSFSLAPSETLAIVGESGSGKTVTALSLLRLIPTPPGRIDSGAILFGQFPGEKLNLLTLPEKEMDQFRGKSISMVFQEPMTSLNPVFTCGDQVAETLKLHLKLSGKQAKERVLELFNEVKLPRPGELFHSYPHQLSGGQKQRVMIAMAIACDPAVLIADEPTTALDVTVQKTILELLKNLQESRKMSILFITHDLGIVSGIADRVVVMYQGKIVEEGDVERIFRSPGHPYTRGLMACRPPLDVRLKRLPTIESLMEAKENPRGEIITADQRKLNHQKLYTGEPILEIRNLERNFHSSHGFFRKTATEVKALDSVSFSVYPGETLGIVGESGSGKTTLARVVLELIPPTEGRILYKNRDITCLTASKMKLLRKDLQLIFQDPFSSLNPRLSIGSAILEPMKVHRLHGNDRNRKEKVIMLLEKVGLNAAHYHRYPHEFSGGQRQRICIARALAVEPQVIICDESVSALDVSIQAQVLNLLNDLKGELRLTYIFISHDLSVVKFMADRLIVMKNGRIVEIGDADDIYNNPQSDYTKNLLDSIPKPTF